jgi:L-arabinose isomerase
MDLKNLEVWFVTGSQNLYGEAALRQVAANAQRVVEGLNSAGRLPMPVVFKPVVTSPDSILDVCREANAAAGCAGLIFWMHTFSPAKMWIAGLKALQKPFLHLHTQFYRDLPWATIDMDFMNLHQAAHGDREFGFICTRMGKRRKVVVGHWEEPEVQDRVAAWMRAAAGAQEIGSLKVARFGDNMRQVAVTEGDKVEAQLRMGVEVNGYGVSELVRRITEVSDADVDRLTAQYEQEYAVAESMKSGGHHRHSLHYAARQELGLRHFLEAGRFMAFTDTFEDLHGLMQLPGLAVQRLMAEGYGFGAEGDWKTAALCRAMKVMAQGLSGGTSFMEDYTYHFDPSGPVVLGAHMLEICASLAAERPSCEIHPLSIGGKADPVRLVFTAPAGKAVNVAILDLGDRFRLLLNEVEIITPPEALPRLPVARAVWKPQPDLKTAAAAWIHAGGPHHTVLSQAVTTEQFEDFAEILGIECLKIDGTVDLGAIKNRLRWNEAYYSTR